MSGPYGPYGGNFGGNAGGDFGVDDFAGDNVGANKDDIDFQRGSPLHPSAASNAGSDSVASADTAPISPYVSPGVTPAPAPATGHEAGSASIDSMELEYGYPGGEGGIPASSLGDDTVGGADDTMAGPDAADAESEVQEAALRRVHSELVRLCEELSNPPPAEHGRKRARTGEVREIPEEGHSSEEGCDLNSEGCKHSSDGGDGHSACEYLSSGGEEDASMSGQSTGSEAEAVRAKKRCRELLPAIAEELERLQHVFRDFTLPPAAAPGQAMAGAQGQAMAGGQGQAVAGGQGYGLEGMEHVAGGAGGAAGSMGGGGGVGGGLSGGGGMGGPPQPAPASKKLHTRSAVKDPKANPSTGTTRNNPNLHADGSWAGTTSGADFSSTGMRDAQGAASSPEAERDSGAIAPGMRCTQVYVCFVGAHNSKGCCA
jgi:hypothetical protein